MRIEVRAAAVALAVLAALGGALAQPPLDDDVPLPPRIGPEEESPQSRLDRPNAARLAPLPEGLEEVVVVADPALRLPDLGTSLRLEREAQEAREARIQVSFLPPLEPADPRYDPTLLEVNPELRRTGYIEIFRLRFGRRRE